jgi:glycolate oxidase
MLLRTPSLPRPTASSLDQAHLALDRRLGCSKVLADPDICSPYARDDSDVDGGVADLVVLASHRDDVAIALEIAERFEIPVTPRAAATGRSGGAVPAAGGIVLVMTGLAQIKEIDRRNLVAVVQPGVITGEFQRAVEAEGLFYPPDPSSADACTLGGNIAENAGGPRAFKYGVTRDYVLGLEGVLMGGQLLNIGRRTSKGVTGYDVTSLLVGSEGTLAVFTEATLRLLPKPEGIATALALFDDVIAASEAVGSIVAAGLIPRCLELLDDATLDAVRASGVAVDRRAGALLLIELDGESAGSLERLGSIVHSHDALDVLVAQDEGQRARLWTARKSLSIASRKMARHKLSEDVVVPPSRIPALLAEVRRIGLDTGVRHLAYGHAGDGNLHVNWLWDDASQEAAVLRSIEALMRATVALGGTLSGEHGIGLSKLAYLPIEQSEALIALQRDIKKVFDQKGLLNPGKIFPALHHAC